MKLEDSIRRAGILADRIRRRGDVRAQRTLERLPMRLDYRDREALGITDAAWEHVSKRGIEPHRVFAHPDVLQAHPHVSLYYRGLALLSQKRVQQHGQAVASWEDERTTRVRRKAAERASRIYNAVISSVVTTTVGWTLDDGYRNILANMGISLDGMYRNRIGRWAEDWIKERVREWIVERGVVAAEESDRVFRLRGGTTMVFGSEPDIVFRRDVPVAAIEIKGGKDPAGALERLGAMRKSFEEHPETCQNYLIAGVVTEEMAARLRRMRVKTFLLDELASEEGWRRFIDELFHYDLRIVDLGRQQVENGETDAEDPGGETE